MKTLTLLRHAKSSWDDPALGDFDRPLNARGAQAARRMGREMRALGLAFDEVRASPARRAVETVAGAATGYARPLDPAYDSRIYLATSATLLAVVRETDDAVANLLLVGHNPGFHAFALRLTGDDGEGPRAELSEKYPTGALAEIRLPIDRWSDLVEGRGALARFIRPRELVPATGEE